MDDTLADPLVGRLLDGRYAVTARIAHGGMATVYLALDTRLDREVAVKVMHAELARDDDFVRRFIGEAKSVARLSHQNVVAVFDQGADGPFLYLAMEYVPGRTLKDVLRERGRFSPAAALEIMTGVLDGLAAAHASGIVHRDVKPENVLLTADGRVKVADFGLARAQAAVAHTRAGLLIGTVAYLPPEQVTGAPIGPRSDVYSAGVMLFELLTGRQPFTGDNPLAIAYQHVNQDMPAPSSVVPGIPMPVDQLVLAATSRDPALRPADAGEFVRVVRRVREDLAEQSGQIGATQTGVTLTGVMGAGVQGLAEAPWLNLDTPAATNGWWVRGTAATPAGAAGGRGNSDATMPPANGSGQFSAGGFNTGSFNTGSFSTGGFSTGQLGQDGPANMGSHTLVVHRDQAAPYRGREPFLQRWLFSPRLAIIALIVILGAGLGLGGWWFTSGRYTQVPSVTGDSVAAATTALTTHGFKVTQGARVHSNTAPEGTVMATNPSGRVTKGSRIALLISAGPFTSVVPKVQGGTLSAAEAALQRVHLSYRVQQTSSAAPVGTVLGTTPAAGTTWPQTKPVAIAVSVGVSVPNFVGMNVTAVQQWASQNGANLEQQPDPGQVTQQPGTITGQQPAPGSPYTQGETITVQLVPQDTPTPIPSPDGLTAQQATALLESAGFQVTVTRTGPGARVWYYSPSGQAPAGTTITIFVGF